MISGAGKKGESSATKICMHVFLFCEIIIIIDDNFISLDLVI